jgi:hypothetical protein
MEANTGPGGGDTVPILEAAAMECCQDEFLLQQSAASELRHATAPSRWCAGVGAEMQAQETLGPI